MSLWYRVVALHLEAIRAYGAKGKIVNLLVTAAALPVNLIAVTLRCLAGAAPARGPKATATISAATRATPILVATAFLWLWVVAVTGAYIYQFRSFAHPILTLLGLT